ncbi:MAG: SDR family oxidoreductase [Thermoproteota archaeon]|nr:SDR family oxidoreductase [Thermoproteota archaeon]
MSDKSISVGSENRKIALVTGSSSGIGLETSLLLARNNFYTYATMRDCCKSKEINGITEAEKLPLKVLQLDVNSENSIKDSIEYILQEQKRIDILVNNAGYALFGAIEELAIEEIKNQFETNLFGIIRLIQNVVPIMRNQKTGGVIVNVSSIAGLIGFPLTSAYVSSKFALEGLTESLAYELEPLGIKLILIEPGVTKTNFNSNLKIGSKVVMDLANKGKKESPYAEITERRLKAFNGRFENGTLPIDVAKSILHCIRSAEEENNDDNPLRLIVGDDAKDLFDLKGKLPDREIRKRILQSVLKKDAYN